jgi:HAMP domain-containing protein
LTRLGSFKVKLVVWFALLALLPLVAAFYGYDTLARRSETRRVDASLEAGLRGAVAAYSARLDSAAARARRLASEPAVQAALRKHDRAALARLLPAPATGLAAKRTVAVVDRGRTIGRVTVPVPVDTTLLARIGRGLTPGDRLVALKRGVVVAGEGRGERVALTPGAPAHVRVANASYRALATSPLTEPRGVELAALAPQSTIDTAAGAAERRVAGALAAALLLFGLATYLLGRSIVRSLKNLAHAADEIAGGRLGQRVETRGHDEFAQVGRAFNRMAAQLELRLSELETERTHVQHSVARFGEALAATHDPTQLVRIVVE